MLQDISNRSLLVGKLTPGIRGEGVGHRRIVADSHKGRGPANHSKRGRGSWRGEEATTHWVLLIHVDNVIREGNELVAKGGARVVLV